MLIKCGRKRSVNSNSSNPRLYVGISLLSLRLNGSLVLTRLYAQNGPSSAASKSPAFAKPRVALAFQPMSIKRRTGSNHSIVKSAAAMTKSVAAPVVIAERKEEPKTFGVGLGVSSTTEVRIPHEQLQVPVAEGAAGMHFFQATYRDEYNPARPNSYEAFCEERDNKKKLEQVKRELDRRQREQDEEVDAVFPPLAWQWTMIEFANRRANENERSLREIWKQE